MPDYVHITSEYMHGDRAGAIPGATFDRTLGWILPPPIEEDSARIALRLFPELITNPDIVAAAVPQDIRPIDKASAAWCPREPEQDPWQRVRATMAERGMEPHEFQRTDVDYCLKQLDKLGGAYLGWAVGLGKTLGALMVMDAWGCNFVLVACPNHAKLTEWLPALVAHAPWMEPLVIEGTKAKREATLDVLQDRLRNDQPTVVVVHYEGLALVAKTRARLAGWKRFGQWDLVVCDEAHRIKNPKAQFVRALYSLERMGTLLLSGTVQDGDIEDLYAPMRLMQPDRYSSRWRDWNNRFGDYAEGRYGKISLGVAPHRLPELRDELGEVLVVRCADDELDIPFPHETDLLVDLLPDQRRVYDELVDTFMSQLPSGDIIATDKGAPLIASLRRIVGCVQAPEGGVHSSKLDLLEQRMEDCAVQTLTFTWHRELARATQERLDTPLRIDGDVSNARRAEILRAFKAGEHQHLVATLGSLSEAVNLQNVGRITLLEHSWRPLDNEQGVGRAVRQGQKHHVVVDHIRARCTVDTLRVLPRNLTKTILRQLVVGR